MQKLETVVELRRVASVLLDDGEQPGQVWSEQVRLEHGLARVHPVLVASQSIYLAVVDQIAVGMGALPAGEGVGAEAGVYQDDGRLDAPVGQVRVVGLDLGGGEHSLVDEGPAGKAAKVEVVAPLSPVVADLAGSSFADGVEPAFEVQIVCTPGTPNEDLADAGFPRERRCAQVGFSRGHGAPAQDLLPLFCCDSFKPPLAPDAVLLLGRQENHTYPVLAGFGKFHSGFVVQDLSEETVRHLKQNSRAVPGIGFAAARSAMVQVAQDRERLAHEFVGGDSLDMSDEANAAGIALAPGVIEALPGRHPGYFMVSVIFGLTLALVEKTEDRDLIHACFPAAAEAGRN